MRVTGRSPRPVLVEEVVDQLHRNSVKARSLSRSDRPAFATSLAEAKANRSAFARGPDTRNFTERALDEVTHLPYNETLTGDYAVSDTLPPSDQLEFWQTFTQISLNGTPFFTGNAIVGPESQDDIWSAVLNVTGLTPAQLAVLKAILVNYNILNSGGEFDYAYNFVPGDRTHGTFAVGSDKNLDLHRGLRPLRGPIRRLRLNLCS